MSAVPLLSLRMTHQGKYVEKYAQELSQKVSAIHFFAFFDSLKAYKKYNHSVP